jgi:hypothetical protein
VDAILLRLPSVCIAWVVPKFILPVSCCQGFREIRAYSCSSFAANIHCLHFLKDNYSRILVGIEEPPSSWDPMSTPEFGMSTAIPFTNSLKCEHACL